jgi:hypothetical protein
VELGSGAGGGGCSLVIGSAILKLSFRVRVSNLGMKKKKERFKRKKGVMEE